MDATVRAIDVGYGNTKYVSDSEGGKPHFKYFPSIAPLSTSKELADVLGARRRSVLIEVEGLTYEVGPDAVLAQEAFTSKNMDDDYVKTPECLALVRGALLYMEVDAIDLLVVGLPVSTVTAKRATLEQRLVGSHPVGDGRTVRVDRTLVLAQPRGALRNFMSGARRASAKHQRNLIVDCGARTFDWLLAQGLKPVEKRSGAVNRGMLDVQASIAESIGRAFSSRYTDYERIDRALTGNRTVSIFGKDYDISAHIPAAQKIARDAVTAMRRQIQDGIDVDNVVLCGGGATFFKDAVQDAFPRHDIRQLPDGMYANVRGFYLAGTDYIAALSRSAVSPDAA